MPIQLPIQLPIELPIELPIVLPIVLAIVLPIVLPTVLPIGLPIAYWLVPAYWLSRKHNPQTFSEAQPADFLGSNCGTARQECAAHLSTLRFRKAQGRKET